MVSDSDISQKFCSTLWNHNQNQFLEFAKKFCNTVKKSQYATNFYMAGNAVDVDIYNVSNYEKLEQDWENGIKVRITRKDGQTVTLPRKGELAYEYDVLECDERGLSQMDNSEVTRLSNLEKLYTLQCTGNVVQLSDIDRSILRNLKLKS